MFEKFDNESLRKLEEKVKTIEQIENYRKASSFLWRIYYKIRDIYYNIKAYGVYREIKWFVQRGNRGWSDRDVWGFDNYLSEVISSGLKHLRGRHCGCPPNISSDEWDKIIDTVIYTFEMNKKVTDWDEKILFRNKANMDLKNNLKDDGYKLLTVEEQKRYELGWKYFKEYFFDFWD